MKAVMIVFNQAHTERIEYMLDRLQVRGFTFFESVQGQGSVDGEPRRGTHTWPEMNSSILTVVEDDKVHDILIAVRKLDNRNKEVGIRAFVWNIEHTI
jgi:nitrogen regulatory protein PII